MKRYSILERIQILMCGVPRNSANRNKFQGGLYKIDVLYLGNNVQYSFYNDFLL